MARRRTGTRKVSVPLVTEICGVSGAMDEHFLEIAEGVSCATKELSPQPYCTGTEHGSLGVTLDRLEKELPFQCLQEGKT